MPKEMPDRQSFPFADAWRGFCRDLRQLGELVENAAGKDSLDRADVLLRIHVSRQPIPELRNNLVTTGHRRGVMLMRWIGAEDYPVPELVRLRRTEIGT